MISDGSFSSNDAETATARNEMIFKRPNNLVPLPKRAPSASQPKRSAGRIKNIVNHFTIPKLFLTLRRKRCPLLQTENKTTTQKKATAKMQLNRASHKVDILLKSVQIK